MVSEVVKANNPLIIAHRGFSAQAPENTIAAFDAAIKSGVPFIELDVTLTKDGELIIIHDDTLDRTTNGKGLVSEFTLEELKKLDAGEWFCREFKGEQLPTLSEVLDRYGNKIAINIEIKSQNDPDTPIVDKVVEMVKNKKLESAVV
ncbi:MAG: glycerophosphodiester phosphodiesterase family protein, partial [Cyanobacteriota bacterium]